MGYVHSTTTAATTTGFMSPQQTEGGCSPIGVCLDPDADDDGGDGDIGSVMQKNYGMSPCMLAESKQMKAPTILERLQEASNELRTWENTRKTMTYAPTTLSSDNYSQEP